MITAARGGPDPSRAQRPTGRWPPACPCCHARRRHEEGCLLSGLSVPLAARCADLLTALGSSTTLVCPRCREAAAHVAGCALAAMTIAQAWATGLSPD